jgi:putative proteasome-type protease
MLLESGLVFASDSRTNAGVDHVSTFRKMTVYEKPDERVLVLLAAGNLSITQNVIALLAGDAEAGDGRETIWSAPNLHAAARVVGNALRRTDAIDGPHLKQHQEEFNISMILGGQIRGEPPRLFNIYAAGNFIEATADTPYFQIGEVKYGKPILDRIVTPALRLEDGAKCALLSFDSTIRSNISVGPPIDVLCYARDRLRVDFRRSFDDRDPYFNELRRAWAGGLREIFARLPDPAPAESLNGLDRRR